MRNTILLAIALSLVALPGMAGTRQSVPEKKPTAISNDALRDVPTNGGNVDINMANLQQLQTGLGIGLLHAMKIVGARPYAKKEQLLERGVLNKSMYNRMEHKMIVVESPMKKKIDTTHK